MNRILKKWDIIRIFRLLLGIAVAIYSVTSEDYIFAIFGGVFIIQAIMNVSCCGAGGCYTDDNQQKKGIYDGQIKKYEP